MSDLVGTTAQVAQRLEVSEDIVQELVRENRIPHVRLGPRKTVFPWAAIEEWLLDAARLSLGSGGSRGLELVADRSPPA